MSQNIARSEFDNEKPVADAENLVPSEKVIPPAQRPAPTMDNFVFVSPAFLKKHGKVTVNRRMYYVANDQKQLAFITDNAGATVTPLAHASLHQLKEGMKQAKLPFQYRIMMFERGHLSLPPESSPVWRELFVTQYVERHKDDATE